MELSQKMVVLRHCMLAREHLDPDAGLLVVRNEHVLLPGNLTIQHLDLVHCLIETYVAIRPVAVTLIVFRLGHCHHLDNHRNGLIGVPNLRVTDITLVLLIRLVALLSARSIAEPRSSSWPRPALRRVLRFHTSAPLPCASSSQGTSFTSDQVQKKLGISKSMPTIHKECVTKVQHKSRKFSVLRNAWSFLIFQKREVEGRRQ